MDDQAALIARRVAMAAAAWFNAPADVEAYRRFAAAVGEWNAYSAPQLEAGDVDELLDDLADVAPPTPLGAVKPGASWAVAESRPPLRSYRGNPRPPVLSGGPGSCLLSWWVPGSVPRSAGGTAISGPQWLLAACSRR